VVGVLNINSWGSSTSPEPVSLRNQPLGQHRRTWLRPSHSGYNTPIITTIRDLVYNSGSHISFWSFKIYEVHNARRHDIVVLLISQKSVTEREYFSIIRKVEVKCSRYKPSVAQRVGRGIALLFHDRGTRRVERSAARPGRTLPPRKIRYPFYRRLGGPQGRSGRAENLVPTGIRTRTVYPVVSRYTDWATRPTQHHMKFHKIRQGLKE